MVGRENCMLGNVSLFCELSPDALAKIESRCVPKNYPRGAVVISEGDEATSMYILLSGSVKVFHTDADGRETILNTLGPGEYFGELALVDESPRSASVTTLEPSRLLMLSKTVFRDFMSEYPEVSYLLIKSLAHQVRRLTETVNMMGRDVYGRIKTLFDSLAVEKEGVRVIDQHMTQQDIASRIASSREMVSRVLKELKAGDYIEERGKQIVLRKKLPENW
jgi:CRP/FNR family cyclic AMP-dependent transcriptional regulator